MQGNAIDEEAQCTPTRDGRCATDFEIRQFAGDQCCEQYNALQSTPTFDVEVEV